MPQILFAVFENGTYFGCLGGVIVKTLNAPEVAPYAIHSLLSHSVITDSW